MRFTSSSTKESVQSWATGLDLPKQEQKNDILIAYFTPAENSGVDAIFSATLTTWNGEDMGAAEVLANMIHNHTRSDMFSIRTEVNYPLEYNDLADYAKDEQDEDMRPAIKKDINIADYDTIFIGYPMWWYTFPMIIYTLFDKYDFSGKTIIPFNTHMGSQDGGTYDTIRELEPNATVIMNGLPVEMKTAETGAAKQVEKWLKSLNI